MFKKLIQIQTQLCTSKTTPNLVTIRAIFDSKCMFQTTTPKTGANSNLYKLRKTTGYGMARCKDALEKNNNNVDEVMLLFVINL